MERWVEIMPYASLSSKSKSSVKSIQALTKNELEMEIIKGLDDVDAGRVRPVSEVFAELKRMKSEYEIFSNNN